MEKKCVCPQCGGSLLVEYTGTYGEIYYLRQDGMKGRKLRSVKYPRHDDCEVYCCVCGTEYVGRWVDSKFEIQKECVSAEKTGKWVPIVSHTKDGRDKAQWRCSECGQAMYQFRQRFCSNCGARMVNDNE